MTTDLKRVSLDIKSFPLGQDGKPEPWAVALTQAFNQLSLQATQAISDLQPAADQFKTLKFKTGGSVATSFPVDFPVPAPLVSMTIAQIIRGDVQTGSGVSVSWSMLAQKARGGFMARVSAITGLSVNTLYEIKLALS